MWKENHEGKDQRQQEATVEEASLSVRMQPDRDRYCYCDERENCTSTAFPRPSAMPTNA